VTQGLAFRIAAALGFLAVALGAFGAHALKDLLMRNSATDIWQTAVFYHAVHAVSLLVLATQRAWRPGPWWCFLAGILLFSASLYLFAVTGARWLAIVTPFGGISFLVGWAWLTVQGLSDRPSARSRPAHAARPE
jgi:uncharacterized membrane protein YgdD (TMEM256/DUF423 family)